MCTRKVILASFGASLLGHPQLNQPGVRQGYRDELQFPRATRSFGGERGETGTTDLVGLGGFESRPAPSQCPAALPRPLFSSPTTSITSISCSCIFVFHIRSLSGCFKAPSRSLTTLSTSSPQVFHFLLSPFIRLFRGNILQQVI